jgi:hypothetical protein
LTWRAFDAKRETMQDEGLRRLGLRRWTLSILACGVAACSPTTVFVTSYRPPDAEPLEMRGERMAALVMMYDQGVRARAEDTLALEISRRGAQGIPMYRILRNEGTNDEAAAREAIEAQQVKGLIVMRPMKTRLQVHTPATTYTTAAYTGFWGGYYPAVWGTSWRAGDGPYGGWYGAPAAGYIGVTHVPAHTETYEVVKVEILIYSLKQNRLVWAGESQTVDPGDVQGFVEELTAGTADELRRLWLVPN